ncbi:PAS domain-containing sensor histidine kinase [Mucilaginibacter paludis]|uniref:histidine kinase n=1 Tax=Mucilaginibacter paludis DSM 18603 TaxID=714943 RepID=H1Y368_9SPHI|nr:PAS domain-containing sensor histidine kinase [Mucilaginibacter paludis]EHQ28886.1 histidine kinase [Mucilaginibacter paludis DSM 18603]
MNNNSGEFTNPEKHNDSGLTEPLQEMDIAKIALDSANVGIWIMDPVSGKFLPSERTRDLFGFLPGADMSFEDAMSRVVDKYRKSVKLAIENAFKKQHTLYIEFPITGFADQKQRWLNVTGGFSSSTATNSYFSGIIMDVTEQKQNDLRRSKFIGMVSHELKTPLTALKAYVQMLNNWAKKQKDNFTIGALSKVDKQVKKMLNMINSLLNLSGAEAGKIHLKKEEFRLDVLINEVVEETLFITSTHHIVTSPCDSVTINADREKIEQVLVNLLSNAAKYSDKTAEIEIGCTVRGDNVEVSVRDQGLGIAPADIQKLFLPHYRVESKETEKIAGFGIGLYLCAEIINRHHGKIWAESEPGKGSTFKFTLPVG